MTDPNARDGAAVLRTAVYTRVSTTKQEDGTSPTTQAKRCREEAERRGWTVTAVWHDSISGTKDSRPNLDDMLSAGRRGEFDAVMVYDLDRLARDELTQLLIRREIKEMGLRLVALNLPGGDLESDESVLTAGVLGSVAAYEKKKIVRRMQSGQRARFEAGLWGGGTTPYGYVTVPVDIHNARAGRRAVPDVREDGTGEADVVRTCARLLVEEGMTTGQAAARLNALGLKPRKAPRWDHYVLRRMIENPSLTGVLGWAKAECRHGAGGGTGAFGPTIAVSLDPILSEDEFAAVTTALDAKRLGPRATNNLYPLSRGVLISPCGQRMHGARRRDRSRREYWCPDQKRTPTKIARCSCPRLVADDVEWVVWTTVLDLLSDPAGLRALSERWLESAAPDDGPVDVEAVERAIGERERRLRDGVRNAIVAGVDEATMREVTRDLQEELQGLRAHRSALRSQLAEREARGEAVDRLARLASKGRLALEAMGHREQDAVVRLMGLRVQVLAPDEPKGAPGLDIQGFVPHARVEELLSGRQVSGEDSPRRGPHRR